MICAQGVVHAFRQINKNFNNETGVISITRWCVKCGGVMIDREYQGRLQEGAILDLQIPLIAREKALKL